MKKIARDINVVVTSLTFHYLPYNDDIFCLSNELYDVIFGKIGGNIYLETMRSQKKGNK